MVISTVDVLKAGTRLGLLSSMERLDLYSHAFSLSVCGYTIILSFLVKDSFTKILNISYIELTSIYVSSLQYHTKHGYDYRHVVVMTGR